jgi:cytochrome c553
LLLGLLAVSAAAPAAAPYIGVTRHGTPDDAKDTVSKTCSGCHGMHGVVSAPSFPNLAGQSYNYLLKQLEDFRSGARQAAPMSSMIKTVPKAKDDRNLENLAAYFSSQKPGRGHEQGAAFDRSVVERGYRVYQEGDRANKVPACAACHTRAATGMAPMAVPALAGQNAAYLSGQLERFAQGKRDNSPGHVMQLIAARLDKKEIQAVSVYLQSLHPMQLPNTYAALIKDAKKEPVPGVSPSVIKSGSEQGQQQ